MDVDISGEVEPLSDGLLVLRYLFGFEGTSLTSGAVATDASRADASAIETYLASSEASLDIDGNGTTDALTDGLLALRYLFGFSGQSLTDGAVASDAMRYSADDIETYIESLNTALFNPNKLVLSISYSASIVNDVAQNGSQFTTYITNNSTKSVSLVRFTLVRNDETIDVTTTDQSLLGGDGILEPDEAAGIQITAGAFGLQLPFYTNYYYLHPETGEEGVRTVTWD